MTCGKRGEGRRCRRGERRGVLMADGRTGRRRSKGIFGIG